VKVRGFIKEGLKGPGKAVSARPRAFEGRGEGRRSEGLGDRGRIDYVTSGCNVLWEVGNFPQLPMNFPTMFLDGLAWSKNAQLPNFSGFVCEGVRPVA
jgi:hypothetical protein